jgi:hypothetical protein
MFTVLAVIGLGVGVYLGLKRKAATPKQIR